MIARLFACVTLTAILAGCTTATVTPVGKALAPRPPTEEVKVYVSETEIKQPLKLVGYLSYVNPGKYQVLSLEDVFPDLKNEARKTGGNGVIVDGKGYIRSGFISRGMHVSGRVILVGE